MDVNWNNPSGVPISAFLYSSHRTSTYPLITEAVSWEHGVFLASLVSMEHKTAAAPDIRREGFAMIPYCPYDFSVYLQRWLDLGRELGYNAPKFFVSNWFRTQKSGSYLWPGFGDNIRVLKWICARLANQAPAHRTPLGDIPDSTQLDLRGIKTNNWKIDQALRVDESEWTKELEEIEGFYSKFKMPDEVIRQLNELKQQMK